MLNTWTAFKLQLTMPRITPGRVRQSSNAFDKQDWNPTIGKCHFEVRSVEFLSRIISTGKILPRARKIQKFLTKHRVSKSKQDVQLYLTFESYYKNYIHRMAEKLNPLYKMLKGETQTNIFSEFKQAFDSVNKVLCDASELTIKQPIPGEPNVFMANASFRDPG